MASAATRPVSCVGDGGLLTTAWRSSSLEAGLADLEAMSAARQRPESQLLLCFMSGNAFRRRGEIFCYRRLSLRLACRRCRSGAVVRREGNALPRSVT